MLVDNMIKIISSFPNGTFLKIVWNNNIVLNGIIDTVYETDNGLEFSDYKEYYAFAFKINIILSKPKDCKIQEGQLIEISTENEPSLIFLEDGTIIWDNMIK